MGSLTAGVGGVVGYFGHVAVAAHTRKHDRRTSDTELMKDLYVKIIELRDSSRDHHETAKLSSTLESEAVLLQHAKLRVRVVDDLSSACSLWIIPAGGASPRDKQNVYLQDALDALAAVARGERLPKRSPDYENQLFYVHRTTKKMSAGLVPLVRAIGQMPEVAEMQEERAAWETERRAKRGWRRFILRR